MRWPLQSILPGAVPWPKFDASTDEYLVLNNKPQTTSGLKRAACDMWDGMFGAQEAAGRVAPGRLLDALGVSISAGR